MLPSSDEKLQFRHSSWEAYLTWHGGVGRAALPAIAALIPAVKGAQCTRVHGTVPSAFKMRRR